MNDEKLYWEDFHAGQSLSYGSATISREDILDFARQFDPQPFHLDEEAAARTHFGGLVASGWHTASLLQRMLVENLLNRSSCMGSPGVTALRWLKPVRPGDTLTVRHEVVRTTRHPHRREMGFVDSRCEVSNQAGEVVMRLEFAALFLLRDPGTAAAPC
jgi:acyl dehydratase